jgi:multidrug efflux system outer membrane protein
MGDRRRSDQRGCPARRLKLAPAIVLALAASGCAVGPTYESPSPVLPERFAEVDGSVIVSAQPGGVANWTAFGDPALDRLLASALDKNRGLAQAAARLAEARAIRGLESAALLPRAESGAGRERSKPSGRDPFIPPDIGITETWRLGFDASWEIDLFGAARQARRRARADEAAAEADLAAARIAVAAEVAQAYFALRAEQERLRVQQRQVENLRENLALLELRRDAGRGTELDVARSNALGLAIAARLPQTEAAIARHEQRLAVLAAMPLPALREALGDAAPLPALPEVVPVGSPEEWIRRRPDVAAAERRLAAATAAVGVAVADWFPRLSLVGGFGWTAQRAADLGDEVAERWRAGPSIGWAFPDVITIRQGVRGAEARLDGARARFEEQVLLALEDVESAMAGYRAAVRSAGALEQAVARAGDALRIARLRLEAGAADNLVVLDAERTLLDLEDQLASARLARATAFAALHKALAGDFVAPEGASVAATSAGGR